MVRHGHSVVVQRLPKIHVSLEREHDCYIMEAVLQSKQFMPGQL